MKGALWRKIIIKQDADCGDQKVLPNKATWQSSLARTFLWRHSLPRPCGPEGLSVNHRVLPPALPPPSPPQQWLAYGWVRSDQLESCRDFSGIVRLEILLFALGVTVQSGRSRTHLPCLGRTGLSIMGMKRMIKEKEESLRKCFRESSGGSYRSLRF